MAERICREDAVTYQTLSCHENPRSSANCPVVRVDTTFKVASGLSGNQHCLSCLGRVG